MSDPIDEDLKQMALPIIPVPTAPDDLRVVTKADLTEAKNDIRHEMKLWLGIGVISGNVVAALVASYVHPAAVRHATSAAQALADFLTQ